MSQNLALDTDSEAATQAVAAALAQAARAGDLITLEGPVGAGKTVFVRGLCEALDVPREAGVCSPSYALVNLYDGGRLPVAHLDLYRIAGEDALEALGFRDLIAAARLILIEWPEHAAELADLATWRVRIHDRGATERRVEIMGSQDLPALTWTRLQQALGRG